ncbi:putative type VII secretion system protein EccD [metagenome]|uniref:Putative type VII secretion system protein EccD n=1 Tax=metagenome TaxID=256318 RepID=A0A2P2CF85_9ZZZZ
MPAPLRLTVTGERRRADLVVPGTVPVAELLPDLAELVGVDEVATALILMTTTGEVLQSGSGLEAQGVIDGAVLHLTSTVPRPMVVHDDLVEAVELVGAEQAPARFPPRWSLVSGVAMLSLAAGCLPLVAAPGPSAVGVGGIGVLLLTVAILSGSSSHDPGSAFPGWASAACGGAAAVLALPVGTHPAGQVAAAGLGGLVPAVLALLVSGTAHTPMLSAGLVATAAGLGGLAVALTGVSPSAVLASGLVAAALSVDAIPAVALRAGSICSPQVDPDAPETAHQQVEVATLASGLRVADGLVGRLYSALGLASLLLAPLAARSGPGCAALMVALSVRLLVHSGVHRCQAVRRAALLAGLVGLFSLVVAALWLQPSWRGPLTVSLVAGGVLTCAGSGLAQAETPGRARLLELVERVVLAALLPLATVGSGLLDGVRG